MARIITGPARTVDEIRRATLVFASHDDVIEAVHALGLGQALLVVSDHRMMGRVLEHVHVPDAVIVAPELRGGGSATDLLRTLQRRWPAVLTYWVGRYARPDQPEGFLGARHVLCDGPFNHSLARLGEIIGVAMEEGESRRKRERDLGLLFARDLGLETSTLAAVVSVLFAHRMTEEHMHLVLGQSRGAFNRYLCERYYTMTGGPGLLHIVQHMRALEQKLEAPRRRRRQSHQRALRSVHELSNAPEGAPGDEGAG